MAHGDCLVLPPCFTRVETEAQRGLAYLSEFSPEVRGRTGSQTRMSPPGQVLGWLGPCGFQNKGHPQGRQVEGLWGEQSGGSIWTKALGSWGLRRRRAARDLYWGSSPSSLRSPATSEDSGPVASLSEAGVLWQTHCPAPLPPVE